jgi:hypothetical protein
MTMDSWQLHQLKIMYYGGNRKMQDFLAKYELMAENIAFRYSTKACEHHRLKLRALVAQTPFNEPAPDINIGRE